MSVETLDFGEITNYNSDRGFGFVGRTLHRPSGGRGEVFFHIRAVKRVDPGIAVNLDNDQYQGVSFWFVTDRTDKGEQVSKLWFDAAGIPEPLRQTVVADVVARWQDLDSREPPWLERITERLLGRDECERLKSERQAEIDETRRAEERKRQEELALARQAEERRRSQAEVERLARVEAEHQRLRDAETLRAVEIQRIRTARGINALVHFTRLANLASILRHGLLGRHHLAQHGMRSTINDPIRLDGFQNAVCLSISFPNYKMFYKYRIAGQSAWVVLLLHPAILWELDCAFCVENAASNVVTSVALNERRNPQYLAAMFGDHRSVQRAQLGIPTEYTTHPQAEVLVLNPIEPSRITQVYFPNVQEAETWLQANPGRYPQQFLGWQHYFDRRCDSAFWPSAYNSAYYEDPYADDWY